MPYILRSKNRPGFDSYEPESISAWSEQPDPSMAPVEAWEEVADHEALAAAYAAAPKCVQVAKDEPVASVGGEPGGPKAPDGEGSSYY